MGFKSFKDRDVVLSEPCALWSRFSSRISLYLAAIILHSVLTSLLVLPISAEDFSSPVREAVGFLVTSLTEAFLPGYSIWPDSTIRGGLVVPNFLYFTITEATALLGPLKTSEMVFTLVLIYALPQ